MRKIMRALGCFHAHHIHVTLQHHDRRVFVPFRSRLSFSYYKELYEQLGLYEENKLQIFKYLISSSEA